MDTLIHLVPLYKILAAFVAMLAGIRMRLGLGNSILAGAALTGIVFGLPLGRWPEAAVLALGNEKTLFLCAILVLIMLLSGIMEKTGQSTRLMEALSVHLRRPRLRMAFFPALIGLLPMPGGAVFSAPMLDEITRNMDLQDTDKVAVNYWYRHIWELAWPLYPGIILTASLGGVPVHALLAYTCAGLPLCLVLGWFFVLRRVRFVPAPATPEAEVHNWGTIAAHGLPLLVAILGAVVLEMGIGVLFPELAFEWGVLLALAGGIACAAVQNRTSAAFLARLLFTKHLGSMLYVVVAIFVFKEFMQASGVVTQLAQLAGGSVALAVSAVFLPFLVGLIAGINVAFVGATFPLLLGLLDQLHMNSQILPYLALGQFSGFAGVLVSPLHICFLLTCQYFKVDIGRAWRRVALPGFLVLLFGVFYFLLLTS